jgi:phosphomannomutase
MPFELPDALVVSVSGFRGTVPDPLTPELMTGLGAAFGAFLARDGRTPRVVVGRDSRTSGPGLYRAVVAGLHSTGAEVVELGIVPTPTMMLAVRHHQADGGIGVTASHNPGNWNALKFASAEGMFLDGTASAEFQAFVRSEDFPRVEWTELIDPTDDRDAIARHHQAILELPYLDVEAIRARNFHVALDCIHGAGGHMVPALLEDLGCRVSGIGLTPDGRFPRDPEPTAAHLEPLGDLVRSSGAELGLAVDPDADRLSLVDESGTPLGEDFTLALASAAVLAREPGTVVTNLSSSRVIQDVAEGMGGRLVRSPVGEINVARTMQAEGAVVGGEGNGGVILPALNLTRDAPLGCALLLQHLVDQESTLGQAAARWPRYEIVKRKVAFEREYLPRAYDALTERFVSGEGGEDDRADGLRIDWAGDGRWVHVRPSGTEPVVRVIAEAPSAEAAEGLVDDARTVLAAVAG